MPEPNIIQYVKCNLDTGIRDWPDCYEDCYITENCPVIERIEQDQVTGEYFKIDRYTLWPD